MTSQSCNSTPRTQAISVDQGAPHSDIHLYSRLLRFARPYWPHIGAILLIDLLATPLALLAPIPLMIAVDSVVGIQPLPDVLGGAVPASWQSDSSTLLIFTAVLVVALNLASRAQKLASLALRTYVGEALVLGMQSRMFRQAQLLSLGYHDHKGSADAVYRIQSDASSVRDVAVNSVIPFLTSTATLLGMIYVTARINWELALVALVVAPLISGLTLLYRPKMREQWREVKAIESRSLGVVQEALTHLRVVKAFGQERGQQARFEHQYRSGVRARIRTLVLQSGFFSLVSVTTALGTAVVLFLGVRHVQSGVITLGSLLLVMAYLGQIYGPLTSISERFTGLQKSLSSAERALSLLDHPPDVREDPDPILIDRSRGEFEFSNVSFAYGTDEAVLRGVNFRVRSGARVGVLGETGSGKTTLLGLLNRLHDPTEGEVRLDGILLQRYRVADLRDQFAIVLQEPVLFSTSIRENIAYGRPQAPIEEVEAAARAANVHHVIESLPDGYETEVGERGMRLSGGERQRVALARAFLKDAPILILDEPTSSVDIDTETEILDAMGRLMEGRTTFIVAHRLATLYSCDQLLLVTKGRVKEVEGATAEALNRIQSEGITLGHHV